MTAHCIRNLGGTPGGPNYTSAFRVIGGTFDKTIGVPPGGAATAELSMSVPGDFVPVDHARVREERGLGGIIHVEGLQQPEIFREGLEPRAAAQ